VHVTVPSSYGMTAVLKGTAEIKRRYSRSRAAEPRGNLSRRAPPVSHRLTVQQAAEPQEKISQFLYTFYATAAVKRRQAVWTAKQLGM